jgi:hypothetical protein
LRYAPSGLLKAQIKIKAKKPWFEFSQNTHPDLTFGLAVLFI